MKNYLDGFCDFCGKKTVEGHELLDEVVVLKKIIFVSPFDVVLGEWCSEKCYLKSRKVKARKRLLPRS